jgi:hypothetical protein
MLFANDAFWKSPNVFDAAGIVGVIAGLASIWVSWWLARRDIKKRVDEAAERAAKAAREEIRRVARAVLQTGISATIRSLELAREVCNWRHWARTKELCILAREQLAKVLAQPAANESVQVELRDISASLLDCVTKLRTKKAEGKGEAPEGVLTALDSAIIALHRVESRITGIQPEVDHGHEAD